MEKEKSGMYRRQLLVLAGITGMAGCTSILNGQEIKDSDGDGVIDSEDYAPRDPDVQDKSDIQLETETETGIETETETPTQAEAPTHTETPTRTETPTPTLSEGLINYWRFNEGSGQRAHDTSDRGHTLTLGIDKSNPPSWTETARSGTALEFDASNAEYLGRKDALRWIGYPEFSVSVWVKPDDLSGIRGIWQASGGNNQRVGALHRNAMFYEQKEDYGNTGIWEASYTFSSGTWYHLAWTFSEANSTMQFYVNGEQIRSWRIDEDLSPDERSISKNDGGFLGRGAHPLTGSHDHIYFDGVMDEVRVYNRLLSNTEVEQLADIVSTTPTSEETETKTQQKWTPIDLFDDGNIDGWTGETDDVEHTTSTVAEGTGAMRLFQTSGDDTEVSFDTGGSNTPSELAWYVRASNQSTNLWLNFDTSENDDKRGPLGIVLDFRNDQIESDGIYTSGGTALTTTSTNTWYRVAFKNIDWSAHTYDAYVDGSLQASGVSFDSNIDSLRWINIRLQGPGSGEGHVDAFRKVSG